MSEIAAQTGPGMSWSVRIRLSLMMFLQFMMFAVFWVPLAPYLNSLGMSPTERSWALSSMALGCLASPIIGMIADRHFASQKVLAVLNLLSSALLLAVIFLAKSSSPIVVIAALVVQQLCYMPTWGLTSSIAMAHSPAEKFPQIRVFGSIGWVAAGIFSIAAGWFFLNQKGEALKIDGTNIPFYCGAATGVIAALVALMLPNTPPPAKGQKASIIDALGLRSFSLMKDVKFAIFIIISTLVMIPFVFYWSYFSLYLDDNHFQYITFTMNWGQCVEMFAMLLVPLALAKFGVKWTMVVGLLALVARYLFFWGGDAGMPWMTYAGILVHGVIFGFFFVGGQVYVGKKAPKEIQAQAQGLLFLITFGVGMLAANFIDGWIIEQYKYTTSAGAKLVTTHHWQPVWLIAIGCSVALMLAMALFFRFKSAAAPVGATGVAKATETGVTEG